MPKNFTAELTKARLSLLVNDVRFPKHCTRIMLLRGCPTDVLFYFNGTENIEKYLILKRQVSFKISTE